jgi:PKD repeat protein
MDSYLWEFGDGFACVAKDPVYLYHAPGIYAVNLTVTKNCCSKSCVGRVEVRGLDCGWTSNAPVCNGTPVQLKGPTGMDSYQWEFGDGTVSSSQDPSHLYSAPGTFVVNLTVTKGGCAKACTGSIEIRPTPDCSWSSNGPVCSGTPVQLTGPEGMDAYNWELGDGAISSSKDPSNIYSAPGSYSINLTVTRDGCSKTCKGSAKVRPMPGCSWTSNSPVCNGTGVRFRGPTGMDSYRWEFGDGFGSQSENPVHLYYAAGTYRVLLRATKGGCSKDCATDVSILPGPEFSITAPDALCSGSRGYAASTAISRATYAWSIENGEIVSSSDRQSISFTAGESGTTRLKARVTSAAGCTKDSTKDITITPGPDCSWTSSSPVCNGSPVQFNGPAGMDAYKWDFGDGQISQSKDPVHLYSAPGAYAVNLRAGKGGCWKDCTKDISIIPAISCTIMAPDAVCPESKGNATSTAILGATYAWSILNGEITSPSDRQSINFTVGNSGITRLTLNVTKEGSWNRCYRDIAIKPKPGQVYGLHGPDSSLTSDQAALESSAKQPSEIESYERDAGGGQVGSSERRVRIYPG